MKLCHRCEVIFFFLKISDFCILCIITQVHNLDVIERNEIFYDISTIASKVHHCYIQ